jgi:membrane associated rhomboid family serine protease
MKLGVLYREIKDFPATFTCCTVWVLVFGALSAAQLTAGVRLTWTNWLLSGIGGGHRFGDIALLDIRHGEVWRLLTSTCVHYSILHIVLNLVAMYQLGTLVESWYGSALFAFIYGLIGGLGNLAAVLARFMAGSDPRIHSGGGSVVIIGLVGLCAVAGWQSETRMGKTLGRLMVVVLFFTALVGIALPRYIDNWGHAGGALAGAVIGVFHRALLRAASRPAAWGAGACATIVMLACGAAQVVDDRREAPAREEERLLRRRFDLDRTARELWSTGRLIRLRGDPSVMLRGLDNVARQLDPPLRAEIMRLLAKVAPAKDRPLSREEAQELARGIARVLKQLHDDSMANQRRLKQLRQAPAYRRPGLP